MAVIVMHNGIVKLDNASGTPTDISAQVTSVTLNVENVVGSYFTLSSTWEQQAEGGRRMTADVEFVETPDTGHAHELFRAWLTGATRGDRTFLVDSPDSQAGSMRYTGEVRCTGMSPIHANTAGSGDPVKARANLRWNGAPTIAVIV